MWGVIQFLVVGILFYPFILGPWKDSEKHPRPWFWFSVVAIVVLLIGIVEPNAPWWLLIVRSAALVFCTHSAFKYREKVKATNGQG